MRHWKWIIFLIAYGEMHDLLAWKRLASLIKFLRMNCIICKIKDALIFGKLIQNLLDKKWVWRLWELCEYFGYFKDFCETTRNWTVFWFHVNCELFMFLPLGCDMWLSGDYPARYYSLCDIGILARYYTLGSVWLEEWKNGRMEN